MELHVEPHEKLRRDRVLRTILECIRTDKSIRLPDFDRGLDRPSDRFALQSVGIEPNDYSGTVDRYRYQFEGEEDLLHVIVSRIDATEIDVEQGQTVAGWLLEGVPTSMIWLKPGKVSQHFFVGHDELIGQIDVSNAHDPR